MDSGLLCIGFSLGLGGWLAGWIAHHKSPINMGKRFKAPYWVNILAGCPTRDIELVDYALVTQVFTLSVSSLIVLIGFLGQDRVTNRVVFLCNIGGIIFPLLVSMWIRRRSKIDEKL